ncbi:MAG TPA: SIS domain-containing protein [bacterium]|nr:SIS domain-containing protein [bacterium]
MTQETRTKHPFHMYEAMQRQPETFARVVARGGAAAGRFAAAAGDCDRLFVVGIGTSHHAALVGEHLVRAYGGDLPVSAHHSFDFALYGPRLTVKDAVIGISHRGNKDYTARSLARAREAGCRTALVTGEGNVDQRPATDVVFETVPQEQSSTHTVSYVGSIGTLALIAAHLGRHRTGARPLPDPELSERIPGVLGVALVTEAQMAEWARAHAGRRRIWVVGGGPGAITATEIALKIKEAAYLQAEGLAIEAMLHGPFQCTEPEDLFVLIAPAGAAQPRLLEFAGMVTDIGAAYVVVSDGTPTALQAGAAGWCVVPAVPEPFTALTCLVPLQLFSYALALVRGTNPDVFRLDDPRFAHARARVRL